LNKICLIQEDVDFEFPDITEGYRKIRNRERDESEQSELTETAKSDTLGVPSFFLQ
jgi:hypothetical protein